jgi:chromosome partitioning protein
MIISVANQKGGAAKTTTAVNLAAGLVLEGYKVLLLDMDPQTNATQVFLHPDIEVDVEQSLYSPIIHYSPITPLIRKTALQNLDFVPAHIRMSGVDLELANVYDNRGARLRRALNGIDGRYDYIIIDNPPALGLLTVNSFVASDRLLIPVSTGFFALTGLVQLLETVEMVKQTQLNPALNFVGVLCTFSERTNVSKDVEQQLRHHFDTLVFDTSIPKNISLEEAHSNHTHIFAYAPNSAGARAYRSLVKEVLAR